MTTEKPSVLKEIAQAFSRMVSDYGFSGPVYEQLGHEQYFRYVRGSEAISVMVDEGGPPLIELFLPVKDGTPLAVPWAELNGIPRYRRFPKVKIAQRWGDQPAGMYFQELAAEFERVEREFLGVPSVPNNSLQGRRP